MVNIYKGNIRKRISKIYPENDMLSIMNTIKYKEDAILVEVSENKFMDIDDLFSKNKQILNLYAFNIGELYVDVRSLVSLRTETFQKVHTK